MSKSDSETFFGRPEFERGKFGWAKIAQPDGGEELYRRATTVAGYMEDKEGLITWKSAMAAFGFARSKSLLSALSVLDWAADKPKVKDLVARAQSLGGSDEAADLGTAFHRVIERYVAGETIDYDTLPEGFGDALDAFIQFKKDFGLTVEASELTVVDDAHQIAGTADAVFSFAEDVETPFGTIPAGTGVIGDFKTGSVSDLSGLKMGQQLSIYSHADPYHAGTGQRTDWPVEIDPNIGLILKIDLDNGAVVPWWLDLETAYQWIELSLTVASTRTAAKKAIAQAAVATASGTKVKAGTAVDDSDLEIAETTMTPREVGKLITSATTAAELTAIRDQHGDLFTEKMTERLEKKLSELGEAPADSDLEIEADQGGPAGDEAADRSAEIREALGKAETVDDLRAVWKKYADDLSDKQKAAIRVRVDKLKAAEAKPEPEPEPEVEEIPAGTEAQVAMPDWMLDDDSDAAPAVEKWSVEDAKARAAEVKNLGELRELFKEFHREVQSGNASPDTLDAIGARSGELK